MYEANLSNQLFSAALPLKPLTTWAGSACTVMVAVPQAPALAGLGVSSVGVTLTLPDGHTVSAAATHVACTPLWVATFAADEFVESGHVEQGLMITVAGTDEHEVVRTWIVAKGDVDVMAGDAAPVSGGSYYAIKLRDEAPDNPVEGDAYVSAGALSIYHDGEWVTIGAVDATLTTQGAAADAKAVGDALRGGFTEWVCVPTTYNGKTLHVERENEEWNLYADDQFLDPPIVAPSDATNLTFSVYGVTATRHLITPTKTSQLTNDGAPNGGGTPYATTAQIPDVTGKADKAVPSAAGNLASLTAQGNLADSGAKTSDFATPSDLPYRLVEPGKWEFSGLPEGVTNVGLSWYGTHWGCTYVTGTTTNTVALMRPITEPPYDGNELSLTFSISSSLVTATRASLPGHLLDRGGNRVVVTGDTTLTLPAAVPGYLRDFIVRLEISGSTVPTITFAAPTGETITYETDGDEFPVPDEVGTWSYSFTENCVAHTFAVSLKKVNVVAQGGS